MTGPRWLGPVGLFAQTIALDRPDLVRSLVLIDAAARFSADGRAAMEVGSMSDGTSWMEVTKVFAGKASGRRGQVACGSGRDRSGEEVAQGGEGGADVGL